MASLAASSSIACITSPFDWSPKRVLTTDKGTFPGRKPGIFAVLEISVNFSTVRFSISPASIAISNSRESPLFNDNFICILCIS